jgi:hypothetical protein
MASGGARVRSGPGRDPNAIRRNRGNDRSGFVRLPAAGRTGEPPVWPLPRPTKFELERWVIEWRRPQAIMWEQLGQEIQVALYIRNLRDATKTGSSATRMTSLQRQMDNLGLSVPGLAHNRWIIDEGERAAVPRRAQSSSAKDRLEVLQGGADVAS